MVPQFSVQLAAISWLCLCVLRAFVWVDEVKIGNRSRIILLRKSQEEHMRTLTLIALLLLTGCSEFFGNKAEAEAVVIE